MPSNAKNVTCIIVITFNVSEEVAEINPEEYATKTASVETNIILMIAISSITKVQNPEK